MIDRIRDAVEALNAGDIDSFYALLADDCVLTSAMGVMRGRQAILDGDRSILQLMNPHYRRLVAGPIMSGDAVVSWGVFGGTVAATGKSFESEICNVMHVKDGQIVAWESYTDLASSADAWVPDREASWTRWPAEKAPVLALVPLRVGRAKGSRVRANDRRSVRSRPVSGSASLAINEGLDL